MKKILSILLFVVQIISGLNAQPAAVTEYIYVGQPSFMYNRNVSQNFSFSKGTYLAGTEYHHCIGGYYSGSIDQYNCGSGTGQYVSKNNTIIAGGSDGIEILYPFNEYKPAYNDGAYQGPFSTTASSCANNPSGSFTESRTGSCTKSVSASNVDAGTDIKTITLDFKSKVTSINICKSGSPINLKTTDFWTYISVPKNYGDMTFTASGAASGAISGTNFNPAGLAGEYTITGNLPFWNGTATASFIINVIDIDPPFITSNVDTVYTGEKVQFTSLYEGSEYLWEFGNGGYSIQKNPTVYFPVAGIYNVTYSMTTSDDCSANTSKKIVVKEDFEDIPIIDVCENLELESAKSRHLDIFPNPFESSINLDFSSFSGEDLAYFEIAEVKIVNLMGEEKFDDEFSLDTTNPVINIDLVSLALDPGLYIININYGFSSVQYRLIKK